LNKETAGIPATGEAYASREATRGANNRRDPKNSRDCQESLKHQ